MPGPVFLRGDGVELRTVEREDVAFIAEHLNDPRVRRRFPDPEAKPAGRLDEEFEARYRDDATLPLLICPEEEGAKPVGMVVLMRLDEAQGTAELGYWVGPDHWGEGYATAAARAVLEYAFTERRLERVAADAIATNEASRAVLEKLGFVEEGRQRAAVHVDGERVDRVGYGLLREEWADEG